MRPPTGQPPSPGHMPQTVTMEPDGFGDRRDQPRARLLSMGLQAGDRVDCRDSARVLCPHRAEAMVGGQGAEQARGRARSKLMVR